MTWQDRQRLFYWGSSLALLPALAFLPTFVVLVFQPSVRHATAWAMLLFPVMAIAEFLGVFKLVQSCVQRPFHLLTLLSFGAWFVLLVIATYTGLFLATLAQRM
jgi:hypothetical protein